MSRWKRWIESSTAEAQARRNARAGRSKPCDCDHEWGVHMFDTPHPCLVVGCNCDAFRDAKRDLIAALTGKDGAR